MERNPITRRVAEPDHRPGQFALLPPGRLIHLIARYEGLCVDAEHLPPAPHRPPLPYVEKMLSELRRELVSREFAVEAA